jgi:hypothetical protein
VKHIIAQVSAGRKFINSERSSVETVQAVFRAEPHKALVVMKNSVNGILRQTVVDVVMFKMKTHS